MGQREARREIVRVRLSKQARTDLNEIWLYIANSSSDLNAADRLTDAISERLALLGRFPYLGKSLQDSNSPNVRTFPVQSYVIFYEVLPGKVRILRIIHCSRDAYAVFAEE
jgi:toxin ParE1/3/4